MIKQNLARRSEKAESHRSGFVPTMRTLERCNVTDVVKTCKKHGALKENELYSNGGCMYCGREKAAESRKKNPDKVREANRKQRERVKKIIEETGEYKPKKRNQMRYEIPKIKICKVHGELSEKDTIIQDGRYARCRLCHYECAKNWKNKSPDATKKHKKDTYERHQERFREESKLRQKKITKEQYLKLLEKYGDRCGICGNKETKILKRNGEVAPLAIDHEHSTFKLRGLLCSKCNCGIGFFKDNISLLENAIKYLKESEDAEY